MPESLSPDSTAPMAEPQGAPATVPSTMPDRVGYNPDALEIHPPAGNMFGVSTRYVSYAQDVKTQAPELFVSVKTGEQSLAGAVRRNNCVQCEVLSRTGY